jgi:hypothetical protein
MAAGRKMLKALKLGGYALALEASFEDWHDEFHSHVHTLADVPIGGRRFISHDTWNDAWLTALPSDLHPKELSGAAHVLPVRGVDGVEKISYYLTKSPFFKVIAEREAVTKTVIAINALKGLPRYECRGSLREARETARCAA